jgi:hypothetical protein
LGRPLRLPAVLSVSKVIPIKKVTGTTLGCVDF